MATGAKLRAEQHTWRIDTWGPGEGGWSSYWSVCTWTKSRRHALRKAFAVLSPYWRKSRWRVVYVKCEDIRHLNLVA